MSQVANFTEFINKIELIIFFWGTIIFEQVIVSQEELSLIKITKKK